MVGRAFCDADVGVWLIKQENAPSSMLDHEQVIHAFASRAFLYFLSSIALLHRVGNGDGHAHAATCPDI